MTLAPWVFFIAMVVLLVSFDLRALRRRPVALAPAEAIRGTCFWLVLGLTWNLTIGVMYERHMFGLGHHAGATSGESAALQFFTAYLVELSLSIDNLFVIALVFRSFGVPAAYQPPVLFLGILSVLVFRGLFIGVGLAFVHQFSWAVYVFGALLFYTALRLLLVKDDAQSQRPHDHWALRLAGKFIPLTDTYHGTQFIARIDGKRVMTPLAVVLLIVESGDIVFSIDSVSAVFGVTSDPFIAFTSNVFAVLGLRSFYFALVSALNAFRYVKPTLLCVLGFIGLKMLLSHVVPIGSGTSLALIATFITVGITASLLSKPKPEPEPAPARRSAAEPDA